MRGSDQKWQEGIGVALTVDFLGRRILSLSNDDFDCADFSHWRT